MIGLEKNLAYIVLVERNGLGLRGKKRLMPPNYGN